MSNSRQRALTVARQSSASIDEDFLIRLHNDVAFASGLNLP